MAEAAAPVPEAPAAIALPPSKATIDGKSVSEVDVATIVAALKKAGATKIKPMPNTEEPMQGWQRLSVNYRIRGNDATFRLTRPAVPAQRDAGWESSNLAASKQAEQERENGREVLFYDEAAQVHIFVAISSDTAKLGWSKKLLDAVVTR